MKLNLIFAVIKRYVMKVVKNISTIDSTILAAYILHNYGPMSHLKLQKLLYFIEGYHLAYFNGASVIDDKFEAWVHGPVSRKIYNELKDKSILYGDVGVTLKEGEPLPEDLLRHILSSEQIELINEVLEMYVTETGITLESITHQQMPWMNARNGVCPAEKSENEISRKDMQEYFSTLVNN